MSWLTALPAALLVAAWLFLPGLAVALALGLRGLVAWGVAPVASVAAIGVSAVVAGALGIPWSAPVPLVAALAVALLLLLVIRRWGEPARHGPEPGRAAGSGLAVAALLGTGTAMLGMQEPDALSQTYDAIFHYNAVAEILATGEASSLAVGVLTDPTAETAFYPAAWHALVALAVGATGASIPLVSNAAAIVVAVVVWPLSCLVLVRQLIGRSAPAMLVTPVVALGFVAFPWSLLTFGVLWPNLLGLALLPVGLAAAVTVGGLARDGVLGRGQAVTIGAGSVAALALAHPSTVFSLALLAAFPLAWGLARGVRGLAGSGRGWAAAALATGGIGAAAVAGYVWLFAPLNPELRDFDWPAFQSAPDAVREVLLGATNNQGAAWGLSLAVLAGAVVAARRPALRWLVPAHVTLGLLFVLASSSESDLTAALTGVWWNDPYRLAAMLPLTGVPLAVTGLLAAGTWVAALRGARWSERPGVVTAALLAVLVVASGGLYVRDHAGFMTTTYPAVDGDFLDPGERAFLERAGDQLPEDAVVAANPWAGGALLYALTGHDVLFPHLHGAWTADQFHLAENLSDVATDERVCRAVREHDVTHALTGPLAVADWDRRAYLYSGIEDLDDAVGFELLAVGESGFGLYRINACNTPD